MMGKGPLAGIRVLDLTSVVVGPSCTLLLAQQGAEVIKLEPPEGDLLRKLGGKSRTPGMAPKFLHFNRGKHSICVDLKSEGGRDVVRRLAASVDVFVSNIRAKALGRLGLDWETLAALNPRLVYCNIAGFGARGRYRDKPAYDTIVQGMSGMADAMGRVFGAPRYMPFVIADHMTGFLAAQVICSALVGRERTGKGQAVEVPMFENMASFVLREHMAQRSYGPDGAIGDIRMFDPNGRPARTADGYICVSPNTDAQARGFFTAAGRPELADDARFTSVAARVANTDAYFAVRAELLAQRTTADWLVRLEAAEVPAMQVNSIADLFDDPHLADVGLIETQTHHSEGEVLALRPANSFSDGLPALRDAPRQGEDGPAILRDLGYTEVEISHLLTASVLVP